MILKRLQATFGKLDGAVLTLQPGLNLLYAPNEGGKSTWCAFLLAMLYGIDASQRDSKAALADKHKYQPWSGKPMAGRIDLAWQGRAVTIERSSTPKAPFSVFRAYDTDSGAPIDELQAATCGQTLTGLPRSVFARSVFLAQEAHALTYDEALEQQLQRLVSTGPQEATFAQAKQQLQQLRAELDAKDIHISELDATINTLNTNVSSLQEESSKKTETINAQDKQLNTAWFVFGTKKELKEQRILDGDKVLESNFNKSYFTKIDIRVEKEIKFYSKSAKILTMHPSGSYTLQRNAQKQYVLRITNPQIFWSTSKYLVVVVK